MKEYEVYFVGNNGRVHMGYFYGSNPGEAKANAVKQGINLGDIKSVELYVGKREGGHI